MESLATKMAVANVAVEIIDEFNVEAGQHVILLKSNANSPEFKEIVDNLLAVGNSTKSSSSTIVRFRRAGSAPLPQVLRQPPGTPSPLPLRPPRQRP